MLAHLAVRQQAAVGVGAGPAAPRLGRGVGFLQLSRGHKGGQAARAAGADPPGCRPPPPTQSGGGTRAGLRCPEPLQLRGEVQLRRGGGLGGRLFILPPSFFRLGRRCPLSSFRPLPLFLLAGTRGEEGADVVLLFFLKLKEKASSN